MTILSSVVIFALIATVGALAWGVTSMAHGGAYDDDHSEKLMIARVAFQALAFILLLVAVFVSFS